MPALTLALFLAQDPAAAGPPPDAPAPRAPRFFGAGLAYWGVPAAPRADAPPSKPGDWGQVVRMPDGSYQYRELPRELVRVLEDPSPGNLRSYFDWKLGRTKKILHAAERMKAFRAELQGDPAPQPAPPLPAAAPPRAPVPAPRGAPFRLLYFRRDGCPPCEKQDEVLGAWLARHPEGERVEIPFGESPELWRTLKVRGTPSLLLVRGHDRSALLEGLSGEDALDAALLALPQPTEPSR